MCSARDRGSRNILADHDFACLFDSRLCVVLGVSFPPCAVISGHGDDGGCASFVLALGHEFVGQWRDLFGVVVENFDGPELEFAWGVLENGCNQRIVDVNTGFRTVFLDVYGYIEYFLQHVLPKDAHSIDYDF